MHLQHRNVSTPSASVFQWMRDDMELAWNAYHLNLLCKTLWKKISHQEQIQGRIAMELEFQFPCFWIQSSWTNLWGIRPDLLISRGVPTWNGCATIRAQKPIWSILPFSRWTIMWRLDSLPRKANICTHFNAFWEGDVDFMVSVNQSMFKSCWTIKAYHV